MALYDFFPTVWSIHQTWNEAEACFFLCALYELPRARLGMRECPASGYEGNTLNTIFMGCDSIK